MRSIYTPALNTPAPKRFPRRTAKASPSPICGHLRNDPTELIPDDHFPGVLSDQSLYLKKRFDNLFPQALFRRSEHESISLSPAKKREDHRGRSWPAALERSGVGGNQNRIRRWDFPASACKNITTLCERDFLILKRAFEIMWILLKDLLIVNNMAMEI
ncbi:hypothetical protein CEXT_549551 [Caerostris extrusa]|uniref:Uncharacterized protein n=1 Tax=Caerostris extrusa TaxID=172846 RepID=A0AAV4N4Q2_CAEEX|nr:hypothetical protein CEXT_549551 [Caerostris extrusa]